MTDDLRSIHALSDEEADAITSGNMARYRRILAEDAIFMPPNSSEKNGEELRQWLSEFLVNTKIEYQYSRHGETFVVGDIAVHTFYSGWTAISKSNPSPTVLHFKGIHLMRRQKDGSWKICREIWNLSPAP